MKIECYICVEIPQNIENRDYFITKFVVFSNDWNFNEFGKFQYNSLSVHIGLEVYTICTNPEEDLKKISNTVISPKLSTI